MVQYYEGKGTILGRLCVDYHELLAGVLSSKGKHGPYRNKKETKKERKRERKQERNRGSRAKR